MIALFSPPRADRAVDWSETERKLGKRIPADYKALIDVFGDADFCDAVVLYLPQSGPVRDLASETEESRVFLTDDSAHNRPSVTPDGQPFDTAQLISWGGTGGGDYWLWYPDLRAPDDPDRYWILLATSDQQVWYFFRGPTTDFLWRFVNGVEPAEGQYGNVRQVIGDGRPYVDVSVDDERQRIIALDR